MVKGDFFANAPNIYFVIVLIGVPENEIWVDQTSFDLEGITTNNSHFSLIGRRLIESLLHNLK
jgi:hypothetical protein